MIAKSFLLSVNAVASLFVMMAAGYLAKRFLKLGKAELKQFNALVFYVFLPLMLFNNLREADVVDSFNGTLVLFAVGMLLALTAATWIITVRMEKANEKRGVIIQACFRTNMLLLGIPLVEQLCPSGDMAAMSCLVAVIVSVLNIMATVCLETFNGSQVRPGRIFRALCTNPLIIAFFLGAAASLMQLQLPAFLDKAATQLGASASPVALILLGTQFEFGTLRGQARNLIFISLSRLVIYPAVGLTVGALLGFRGIDFAALIPAFGAPTAVNSYNMACQMGGDADLAANAVTLTTVLSSLTLVGWIFVFKSLGMF